MEKLFQQTMTVKIRTTPPIGQNRIKQAQIDVSYTLYKPLAATVKKALLTLLTPNKSLNSLVVAMIFLRSEVHSLG